MIRTDGRLDPIARTVTFSKPIVQEFLGVIENITSGVIIYSPFDPLKVGVVVGSILTLSFDTSSMSADDKLQVFYGNDGESEEIQHEIREYSRFNDFVDSLKKEPSGEFNTIDENVRTVLGTERLVTQSKKLNVNSVPDYLVTSKLLPLVANASFMSDVLGYSSLAIQISGTWTGTITFECSANGGDYIALNGIAVNGTAIVASATANGIFRFNIASISKVQVRFSTATTGNPLVMIVASPEPSSLILNTLTLPAISGAVTTTDSVLPGTIITQANPAKVIPVAPTAQTSGINNFLSSNFPQIFQRLRVESAGSNRVPFKQEVNTDKIMTIDEDNRLLLQGILRQLEISNSLKVQELDRNGHPNLRIPEGFVEY